MNDETLSVKEIGEARDKIVTELRKTIVGMDDVIDEMMIEFASCILFNLRIERMSVWIFNSDKSEIEYMGEYDSRAKSFKKKTDLEMSRYPK